MQAEIDKPWGFTRPDPRASGMFFFQNYRRYVISHMLYGNRRI
jgi:hypothetical protein